MTAAAPPQQPAAWPPHSRNRRKTCCIGITLILIQITISTLCLIYIPDYPEFRVVSAAVNQFNTSSPPFISAAIQLTVEARNPSKRLSIFYGPLSAHVSYYYVSGNNWYGELVPITQPVILPAFSQGPKRTVTMSPAVGGAPVAVEVRAGKAVAEEAEYGMVGLRLVLTGKARFMAGAVKVWRNRLDVKCDFSVNLKKGSVGQLIGSSPC